jgi:hypothetical protein
VIRATVAAAIVAVLLGTAGPSRAQSNGAGASTEIEFSNNASSNQRFTVPRIGRRASTSAQLASAPSFTPPPSPSSAARSTLDDVETARVGLFEHFFLSGIACLVRGDPAGAADIFEVTAQIAGDLPQMNYLLALARILADFEHRGRTLSIVQRAMAADADHPLYVIATVLADARLSVLKADGALYFTADGARLIRAASSKLAARKDAYNGKYIAMLIEGIEDTGDASMPQRLNGFAAMLGQGRTVALPHIQTPQALGRLLVLSIPPAQLARYEARFLTGATDEREASSFVGAEQRRSDLRGRTSILVP